jgi:hypothetical protein
MPACTGAPAAADLEEETIWFVPPRSRRALGGHIQRLPTVDRQRLVELWTTNLQKM